MSKSVGKTIYTVGNITKDVYLKLDSRTRQTHKDDDGVPWLDVAFDGGKLEYSRRQSTFGGSAVSVDVFKRFGLDPGVSGSHLVFRDDYDLSAESRLGQIYRYILVSGDRPVVLVPSGTELTVWERPKTPPKVIYLDRTCRLNLYQRSDLVAYLEENQRVGLALWANHGTVIVPHYTDGLGGIEVVFADMKDLDLEPTEENALKIIDKFHEHGAQIIVVVSEGHLYASDKKRLYRTEWHLSTQEKRRLFTDLTVDSLISANFLGGYVLGRTLPQCLLLAKYGVAHADIDAARSIEWLENRTADKIREVQVWHED
jgi:hypothetical protein